MTRNQFVVMTLMLMLAVVAGAFVASVVPPLVSAQAQELRLAPAPPPSAAVVVPSFAELVERAVPSVVHVTTQRTIEQRQSGNFDMFDNPFRRFMREPFGNREEERQEPPRRPEYSAGSGFFFTTDGYILTNKHVVENADRLIVTLDDDERVDAELVGIDPYLDLAVIKVDADREFPALPLGNAEDLRVGEWVVAIGNPVDVGKSVTVGIVSGKGRQLNRGASSLDSYIQTDAAINFGNSGGPLLNTRGEVVGINTAILRDNPSNPFQRSGLVEGIGFALPISQVNGVLDQLVNTGTVKRGYLGVTIRPVTPVTAEWYGIDDASGAVVMNVTPDLPADRAGVKPGDVIVEVDGQPIADSRDLVNAISKHSPGDVVWIKILRRVTEDDPIDEKELKVELGERRVGLEMPEVPERPESPVEPETASALGLTVGELDAETREGLADPDMRGVVITETEAGSPAAEVGLVPGLIVLDVNGRPTPDLAAYRKVVERLESGDPVRIRVAQPNGTQRLEFFRAP